MPQLQPAWVYDALKSEKVSTAHCELVLSWSPEETVTVMPQIEQILERKGWKAARRLMVSQCTQTVKELKIENTHQELLHRAISNGETRQGVDLALRKMVLATHRNTKKHSKHTKPTPPSTQEEITGDSSQPLSQRASDSRESEILNPESITTARTNTELGDKMSALPLDGERKVYL